MAFWRRARDLGDRAAVRLLQDVGADAARIGEGYDRAANTGVFGHTTFLNNGRARELQTSSTLHLIGLAAGRRQLRIGNDIAKLRGRPALAHQSAQKTSCVPLKR
jgi:hypothetical protein